MNTEEAKQVNSKESLEWFLQRNKWAAQHKLWDEIDYVGVDKNFEITHIFFKPPQPKKAKSHE